MIRNIESSILLKKRSIPTNIKYILFQKTDVYSNEDSINDYLTKSLEE